MTPVELHAALTRWAQAEWNRLHLALDPTRDIPRLLRDHLTQRIGPGSDGLALPPDRRVAARTPGPYVPPIIPTGWLCLPTSPAAPYGYDADWLPLPQSAPRCAESPVRLVEGDAVSIYANRGRGWPSTQSEGSLRVSWGQRIARTLDEDQDCVAGYDEDVWGDSQRIHPASGRPTVLDVRYQVRHAIRCEIGGAPYWRWITSSRGTERDSEVVVYSLAAGQPATAAQKRTVTGLAVGGDDIVVRQAALSPDGMSVAVLGSSDVDGQDTHVFRALVGTALTGSVAAEVVESWAVGGVSFSETVVSTGVTFERRVAASGWVTRPFRVEWEDDELVVTRAKITGTYDDTTAENYIGTMVVPTPNGTPVLWRQYSDGQGCPYWLGWSNGRTEVSVDAVLRFVVQRGGVGITSPTDLYRRQYGWQLGMISVPAKPAYYFLAFEVSDDDEVICQSPADFPDYWLDFAWENPCFYGWESPFCNPAGETDPYVLTGRTDVTPTVIMPGGCAGTGVTLVERGRVTSLRKEVGPQAIGYLTVDQDWEITAVLDHDEGVARVPCGIGAAATQGVFEPLSEAAVTTQLRAGSEVLWWNDSDMGARALPLDDGNLVWTARTSWSGTTLTNGQVTAPGGFLWTKTGGVLTWLPAGASSVGEYEGDLGEV